MLYKVVYKETILQVIDNSYEFIGKLRFHHPISIEIAYS